MQLVVQSKIVHVVGTGTIGEPLIGLLSEFKKELGIDEVSFTKRTPLLDERTKVNSLVKNGATLCTFKETWEGFEALGMNPVYEHKEALSRASIVIDCTPDGSGLKNKEAYYNKLKDKVTGFLAQGSETGFGMPYAHGINDEAFDPRKEKFLQIVSCNTHAISAVTKTIALNGERNPSSNLLEGNFDIARRSSDISDRKGVSAGVEVYEHEGERGTHHADDAYRLFKTLGVQLDLFSSAIKTTSQYMHTFKFDLELKDGISEEQAMEKLSVNPRIASTYKMLDSLVFSFVRDHAFRGRTLNQVVVCIPSLVVHRNRVKGYGFTPQDGNSLLSSIIASDRYLYPDDWEDRIAFLYHKENLLFKEI